MHNLKPIKANLLIERLLNKHYGIDVNIPNFSSQTLLYHFSEILKKYGRIPVQTYCNNNEFNARNVNPDLVAESVGLVEAWTVIC